MSSVPMFNRYPPPVTIPSLEQVLIAGDSAGTMDVNMNNQNILNVNNINTTTINGIPYPLPNIYSFNTYTTDTSVSVPSNISYLTITLIGGGGGAGYNSTAGGSSTLTLYQDNSLLQVYTALGGTNNDNGGNNPGESWSPAPISAPLNSGAGGMNTQAVYNSAGLFVQGQNGQTITYGTALISTSTYTYDITIGSGGLNGTENSSGGSGIVYVIYQ